MQVFPAPATRRVRQVRRAPHGPGRGCEECRSASCAPAGPADLSLRTCAAPVSVGTWTFPYALRAVGISWSPDEDKIMISFFSSPPSGNLLSLSLSLSETCKRAHSKNFLKTFAQPKFATSRAEQRFFFIFLL